MKYKHKLSLVITLFMGVIMNAQEFQGVATYKSHRKMDFNNMDDSKISSELQKQLEDQLRKQSQQEYTLNFNRYESTYKMNEKLEAPVPSNSGITIRFSDECPIPCRNTNGHLKRRRKTLVTTSVLKPLSPLFWKIRKQGKTGKV